LRALCMRGRRASIGDGVQIFGAVEISKKNIDSEEKSARTLCRSRARKKIIDRKLLTCETTVLVRARKE
jgi:hypothetical protein